MGDYLNRHFLSVLIGLALVVWGYSRSAGKALPDRSEIDERILEEPHQETVEEKGFDVMVNGRLYFVKPLFSYDISGLIVSKHHAESWSDFYHHASGDFLNLCDLALVWGDNVKSGIYEKGNFSSEDYTAWVHFDESQDWAAFQMNAFSNNHLVTENDALRSKLKQMQVGDQVRIQGWLVEYSAQPDYYRGTSTTRKDTGNHACETIYVTEAEILRTANGAWRFLHGGGKAAALALLGLQAFSGLTRFIALGKTMRSVR